MSNAVPETIRRWHRIALENRPEELAGILADEVVFESPVLHTPVASKQMAETYLRGALKVLNTDKFRYGGEWYSANPDKSGSAVLEFFSEVDGITVNGVDIISWNEAGLITHFKVMARPLKGINVLHQKMGEYLVSVGAAKFTPRPAGA